MSSNLKTPETRRMLRLSVAYGLWGGTLVGLSWMTVNVLKYQDIAGFAMRSAALGLGFAVFSGAVGYLFFSGMILGD